MNFRLITGMKHAAAILVRLAVAAVMVLPAYGRDRPVFLINSEENSAYKLAEEGVMEVLAGSYHIKTYTMQEGKQRFPFRDIDRNNPLAIITIGTLASKTAYIDSRNGNISAPVIISMVLRPDINNILPSRRHKITGVILDIPYDRQFAKIHELLPEVKKAGFLYQPDNTQKMEQAVACAARHGIELVGVEISDRNNLAAALDRLINNKKIDVFWPGVDVSIYTREVLQYIIHKTNRNRIPFIGHSFKYLEWGALLSLDVNYREIGRQTGSLARDVINDPKTVKARFLAPAQDVLYSLNLGLANKFHIRFAQTVIDNAYFTID